MRTLLFAAIAAAVLGGVAVVVSVQARKRRRVEALIRLLDQLTSQAEWSPISALLRSLFLSEWVALYRQLAGPRAAKHSRAVEAWIAGALDRLGSLPSEGEASEALILPIDEAARLLARIVDDPNRAVTMLLEQVKAERPAHAQTQAWSAVDTAVFHGHTVEGVKLGSGLVLAVHGALTRTSDEALVEDPYTVTSMVETMVSSEDAAVVPAAKRLATDIVARLRKLASGLDEGDADLLTGAADDLQELVDETTGG